MNENTENVLYLINSDFSKIIADSIDRRSSATDFGSNYKIFRHIERLNINDYVIFYNLC